MKASILISSVLGIFCLIQTSLAQVPEISNEELAVLENRAPLEDEQTTQVLIHKNPFENIYYVKCPIKPQMLEVTNSGGQIIYSTNNGNVLDLRYLSQASFIRVRFAHATVEHRIP